MFNENISKLKPQGDEKQRQSFGSQSSEIQTHREAAFTAKTYGQVRNQRWWWS